MKKKGKKHRRSKIKSLISEELKDI